MESAHSEGAHVLARYRDDFYAGEPALTVNTFGQGKAYYLATQLDPDGLQRLLGEVCREAGVHLPLGPQSSPQLEIISRRTPEGTPLHTVLNHGPDPITVTLAEKRYLDLLTGAKLTTSAELAPNGVLILQELG